MSAEPQTRLISLVEAVTNVGAGFLLAIVIQWRVYPLIGIDADLVQNGAIAAIFTAVSLARSYAVRRLFSALQVHREREREACAQRLHQRLAPFPLARTKTDGR